MKNPGTAYHFLFICIVFSCLSCSKIKENSPAGNVYNATISNTYATATVVIVPGDSIVIRGDTSHGDQSALIQSRLDPYLRDNNYLNFPAFNALVWTWSGVPGNDRSLMKFNLARVPISIRDNPPVLKKALLYLYQYQRNDGLDIYTVRQTVSNIAELHRIKGNWISHTVNWNNQPALAKGSANPLEDMVAIPAITTPLARGVQDNIVVDITDMVRRMVVENTNDGVLLKMTPQEEDHPYCGRSFGSFSCPDNSKKPRLVLYF